MPPKAAPKKAENPAPKAEKPAAKAEKPAAKAEKPAAKAEKPAAKADTKAAPAPKAAAKPAAKTAAAAPAPKAAAKPAAKGAQPAAKPAAKSAPAAAKKAAPANKGSDAGVYIKNLNGPDVTTEQIKSLFGSCGKITEIRLRRNKYVLVFFDNQNAAKKALEFNGKQMKGSKISVELAKAKSHRKREEYCTTAFIGHLPGCTSKKHLSELCKGFGTIIRIRNYRAKRHAFVYFQDVSAANKAVQSLNGKDYHQTKLSAKLSVRTKEADRVTYHRRIERATLLKKAKKA